MSFTFTDEFQYKDNAVTDAYRKLRTSSPFGIFNSSLQNSLEPEEWETVTNGTGSVNWLEPSSTGVLEVGSSAGDRVLRQTLETFLYQSGTSTLVYMTGVLGAGREGTRARLGIYDDLNGVFFEVRDGALGVVLRHTLTEGNTVETFVAQSNFNRDPGDGTGPSEFNLDPSKAQIFSIDYAWLGVGRVRLSVWIGNCFCPLHEFRHHNNLETPYMGKGDLPLRYEIVNTSAAAGVYQMKQICAAVFIEGGLNPTGFTRSITTAPNTIYRPPSDNQWYNVLSLRIKSGLTRIHCKMLGYAMHSASDNVFYMGIVKNGTLPSLTWLEATEFTEYARLGGAVTGGHLIFSTVLGGNRNSTTTMPAEFVKDKISTRYDGSSETFSLVIMRADGTPDVAGTLNYLEIR